MAQQRIPQELEVELRAVKGELDLAKKTIDRYAHLVAKLYDELDTLHNGICNTCKAKFVPGSTSSSSGRHGSSGPSPIPLSQRVFGGWSSAQLQTGSPQSESTSDSRDPEPPTEQVPFEPSSVPPPAEPDKVDLVEYNRDVRQSLSVHLVHTLKVKSAVLNLKFSRAGKYLAVGLSTGETYIYDMKTLSYRILTTVEYPAKKQPPIYCMDFSPNDKYIATGEITGQIRVWNIAERRVLATFKGHTNSVFTIDFSPDGRFLSSTASLDRSVHIWCMRDGSSKQLLDTEMSSITSCVMSPDSGRYVAAGDGGGMVRIWDFRSGQLIQRWNTKGGLLWSLAFTVDGKGLLSGGPDKTLRRWDTSSLTGSRRGELVGNIDEEMKCLTFRGHTASVNSISVFPNDRWVLSGSSDFTARIWDLRTCTWQCILNGHQRRVWVAASPDTQHLATGSRNGLIRVWKYENIE